MSDFRRPLRQPWSPPAGTHCAFVLAFMTKQGHGGYANEIAELSDTFMLTQGEAGPGHGFCQFTQESLDRIDAQIKDVVQSAVDRYDDWVSDAYA